MTYEDIARYLRKKVYTGDTNAKELVEIFRLAVEKKDELLKGIDQSYTLQELKNKVYLIGGGKKQDYVQRVYDDLVQSFNVSGRAISYSPFSGETYEGKLAEAVEKITDDDIQRYSQKFQEGVKRYAKIRENPETFEELSEFARIYGFDKMNPGQRRKYEEMLAEKELERQNREVARKGVVKKVELGETGMEMRQTKHTKTGADLWVVTLGDRVEKDTYNELNAAAKRLGGYYSSYRGGGAIPGFQFKTEDAARQFMALRDGDVQRQKESNAADVAERLKETAKRKAEAAREDLNRNRQTNTARRARMADSAEQQAQGELRWAATLESLAEAIKEGRVKYLAKITAVTQLETLDRVWSMAHYKRFKGAEEPKEYAKFPRDIDKDLDFVAYPYPSYYGENLVRWANDVRSKPGMKMAAARLIKAVEKNGLDKVLVFRGGSIADLRKLANSLPKYDAERVAEPIANYDRMQRMGITTLPVLKMALLEYASLKKSGAKAISPEEEAELLIKQQERQFVGKKYDGFFPTPEPLVDELLRQADIQPGHDVLEPSAGIGHIADAIKREHPAANLQLVEIIGDMARLLRQKGHEVHEGDFLGYNPSKQFDRIVMNPPFERDADIDHVMHAWQMLKPGGRLVAIMAGNKDGQGKKKEAFREMVDEYGTIERNPEGAFKSAFRSTGVNTVTVVLDKPVELQPKIPAPAQDASPMAAHTIPKKSVLTPAGTIQSAATKSQAGSALWWYQGPISQLSMVASVKVNGQPDPNADWAKNALEKLRAAQKAGWKVVSYRAGALGSIWVMEKGNNFLTRAGLENIGDPLFDRPDLPPSLPGFDNYARRAIQFAASFVQWLETMPLDQQNNLSIVSRRINASPVGKWARIDQDGKGPQKALRYIEEDKPGFSMQISLDKDGDWPRSVLFLKALASKWPEVQQSPDQAVKLWYEAEGSPKNDDMPAKQDCPKEMRIGDIYIDERRFQNRSKLNENVVNSIAENYDENQFDPVVVWDDPQDGKTYLLAGHHRLAGVKKAGRKTIKTRCFEGSEAEAIAYAKELSNANRTLETPLERAAIYRRKLDAGEAPDKVRKQAEKLEGKNARYILNLAYLNPDGKVVNALLALADNSDKLTQNNLEKIADWIGEVRRQFGVLTNQHENECYDFLLENFAAKRPAISRKDEFGAKVSAIVNASDFDPKAPLNLKRIQYKTQGETEYERQMAEIDTAIKATDDKREALKDRLNNPRNPQYVNPTASDYDEVVKLANQQLDRYDEELKALRKQKLELIQKKGQMVSGGLSQGDLFAQAAARIEQVVEEVREQQPKPAPERKPQPAQARAPKEGDEPWSGAGSLAEQYERAYDPTYRKYISGRLKELSDMNANLTQEQVIELGILVRPYVQRFRGALVDVMSTNKRVLAPTANNLARWAEKPGHYDLVGVDIAKGADPTVLAKAVKKSALFNLLGIK